MGFPQLSLWFSLFVDTNGGFSDFSVQCRYDFSCCTKEVTPCSCAKTFLSGEAKWDNFLFGGGGGGHACEFLFNFSSDGECFCNDKTINIFTSSVMLLLSLLISVFNYYK